MAMISSVIEFNLPRPRSHERNEFDQIRRRFLFLFGSLLSTETATCPYVAYTKLCAARRLASCARSFVKRVFIRFCRIKSILNFDRVHAHARTRNPLDVNVFVYDCFALFYAMCSAKENVKVSRRKNRRKKIQIKSNIPKLVSVNWQVNWQSQ